MRAAREQLALPEPCIWLMQLALLCKKLHIRRQRAHSPERTSRVEGMPGIHAARELRLASPELAPPASEGVVSAAGSLLSAFMNEQ